MFTAAVFTLTQFSEKFSSKLRHTNELFMHQASVRIKLKCQIKADLVISDGTKNTRSIHNICHDKLDKAPCKKGSILRLTQNSIYLYIY